MQICQEHKIGHVTLLQSYHHQQLTNMKYLSPLLLALLVSYLEAGSLDLMELNTVQYNVEILDTPVTDAQDTPEVR